HAADQVAGMLADQRGAPAPHRGRPVAEHRRDLDRPVERLRGEPGGARGGAPSPNTGVISTDPSNGSGATWPVAGSPYTGKCKVGAVAGLNFLLVFRSGRKPKPRSPRRCGKSAGATVSVVVASRTHARAERAWISMYSCEVANPPP